MEKFTALNGVAAPFMLANVDTDMIIPKQFLKSIIKTGLGQGLFYDFRFDDLGNSKADFVLNQPDYQDAKIIISGENFGCGSSREHAPWAILDFGIRCVIAPSFASIFYNNCFNNSILPIALDKAMVNQIANYVSNASDKNVTIDLEQQHIRLANGQIYMFDIDATLKHRMLNGLDKIELTLQHSDKINEYERAIATSRPWEQKM